MLTGEVTKENLRVMVLNFYTRVLKDEIVGPFFIEKLGEDMNNEHWKPHLDLLVNFWASIAIGDTSYRGNPFAPHLSIGGLSRKAFEQWLVLFYTTLDEVYESHIAYNFKERSNIIAGNFMRNLRL
jgi:hemoglobin